MYTGKSSYSVPDIKKMLGIGKTSAYALVKQKLFDTTIAGGKIRIMKDSFHQWLNSQSYYKLIENDNSVGIEREK